jgi:hypothetical protein
MPHHAGHITAGSAKFERMLRGGLVVVAAKSFSAEKGFTL